MKKVWFELLLAVIWLVLGTVCVINNNWGLAICDYAIGIMYFFLVYVKRKSGK